MSSAALSIDDLSVVYESGRNKKVAVDRFSLEVREGEFFALLGPNGAGKTSVISTVSSLIPVKHGSVNIFGKPAGSIAAKALIGVVPQELVHHGFFTVNQVLNFFSGYYGISKNQKHIDFLLEHLALAPQKNLRVSQLSGGMKRRLLIAKALVHQPKLLLLDEPSAGVDIELRAILWDFMRELNAKGTTILLTTHYLEEAQRLCERIAIMSHGKLLSLDHTGKLLSDMVEKEVTFTLRDGVHLAPHILENPPHGFKGLKSFDRQLRFRLEKSYQLHEVLDKLGLELQDLIDVQMKEGSLEHAFMKIVGSSKHAQ